MRIPNLQFRGVRAWGVVGLIVGILAPVARAGQYEQVTAKAVQFLRTHGQAPDGSYGSENRLAITALVGTALLEHGVPVDDPALAKALAYIEKFVQPDGGIYEEGTFLHNYATCLSIQCLVKANRDGRYNKILASAEAYIKDLQWDEGEGKTKADLAFGGQGYGKKQRADLSNVSFFADALKSLGEDENSEAFQNVLLFVSRSQNLESEYNTTEFPAKNPDGGFYYTPDAGGDSQAGKTENGGLRSYGSMTYAGLKSMIYAGVGPDDPRVKAAYKWIQTHYDLKSNPGMGDAGLFYYYHTFAKALDALGEETLTDDQGAVHDWRSELVEELARRQLSDGSWVNANSRWLEGHSSLVTAYGLLTLSHCKPKK